jgi:hypothetical protein
MKNMILKIFIVILLAMLAVLPVFAQYDNGSISGIVTDPYGAVVVGSRVRLVLVGSDENQKLSQSMRTNEHGKFGFYALSPGKYQLRVAQTPRMSEHVMLVEVPNSNEVEVTVILGRGCNAVKGNWSSATTTDYMDVIKLALSEAAPRLFTDKEKHKGIIISTRNIKSEWVPINLPFKFVLLRDELIRERADNSGDFQYLEISFADSNASCISISMDYFWAVGKNSHNVHMSGEGITYEYRKENGKWIGAFVLQWIS